MKPLLKIVLGVVLIVSAIVALLAAYIQTRPLMTYMDPLMPPADASIPSDARIVYYINLWPIEAENGCGTYGIGISEQDEIVVGVLHLRREDQILYINDRLISAEETYRTVRWVPSINPWLIFTYRFEIGFSPEHPVVPNAMLVGGDVYESWIPNPLGLLILVGGIRLYRQGKRARRQEELPA